MKWPTVRQVEGEKPWVTYAKRQVYKNNNCISLIVTGPPGSSKSWGLLAYFLQIDPDFDLGEQLLFGGLDVLKYFDKGKIVKGKPVMYDESGIETHALKFHDEINIGLNMFFQTGRHLNYIFGMTVPFRSLISKGVRTLMNCHFRAHGWNSKNETIIKPLILEWNDEKGMFYRKRLLVRGEEGLTYCNEMRFPKIRSGMLNEYERLKDEYRAELYKKLIKRVEAGEIKKEELKLVKCSKLANEMGIDTDTVLNWIKKGLIQARRIGKCWFMTTEERENILNNPNLLGKGVN